MARACDDVPDAEPGCRWWRPLIPLSMHVDILMAFGAALRASRMAQDAQHIVANCRRRVDQLVRDTVDQDVIMRVSIHVCDIVLVEPPFAAPVQWPVHGNGDSVDSGPSCLVLLPVLGDGRGGVSV